MPGLAKMSLLGEEDNDPNHPQLATSPQAMAQGEHRLTRGHHFLEQGQLKVENLGAPFNGSLQTVPDVAHSNFGMAGPAAVWVALGDGQKLSVANGVAEDLTAAYESHFEFRIVYQGERVEVSTIAGNATPPTGARTPASPRPTQPTTTRSP